MSKLYDIVNRIVNANNMEEAERLLYGENGIKISSKEYYENIISNFIKKKESLIKKHNGNLIFDLNNYNDIWNIIFIAEYIKSNDLLFNEYNELQERIETIKKELNNIKNKHKKVSSTQEHNIINQEYNKTKVKLDNLISLLDNMNYVKQTFYNIDWILLENEPENIENQKSLNILKQAINIIHKLRNTFEHNIIECEKIIQINNDNFRVTLPIEYLHGFNCGRIIANENDGIIVERTNYIAAPLLESLNYNILDIQSFFYNVEPYHLSFLLKQFENDELNLYKLPKWVFYIESKEIILELKNHYLKEELIYTLNQFKIERKEQAKELLLILKRIKGKKEKLTKEELDLFCSIKTYSLDFFDKLQSLIINKNVDKCEFISCFQNLEIWGYHQTNMVIEYFQNNPPQSENLEFYKIIFSDTSSKSYFSINNLNNHLKTYNILKVILNKNNIYLSNQNIKKIILFSEKHFQNIVNLFKFLSDYKIPINDNIISEIDFLNYGIIYGEFDISYLFDFYKMYNKEKFNINSLNDFFRIWQQLDIVGYAELEEEYNLIKSTIGDIKFDDFLKIKDNIKNELKDVIEILNNSKLNAQEKRIFLLNLQYNSLKLIQFLLENNYEINTICLIIKYTNDYDLELIKYLSEEDKKITENDLLLLSKTFSSIPKVDLQSEIFKIHREYYVKNNYYKNNNLIDFIKNLKLTIKSNNTKHISKLELELIGMYLYIISERQGNPEPFINNIKTTYEKQGLIKIEEIGTLAIDSIKSIYYRVYGDDMPSHELYDYILENKIDIDFFIKNYYFPYLEEIKNHTFEIEKFIYLCNERFKGSFNSLKAENIIYLLDYFNGKVDFLQELPIEFFTCDIEFISNMLQQYNSNINKSIFGINNPKIIATLIYANTIFSNYQKENNDASLINIDSLSIIHSAFNDTYRYKNNIKDSDINIDIYLNQFIYNKENNARRDISQIKLYILDKLRNAIAHFRFKEVRDIDGNIVEDKIYLYDKYDELEINNFNIILDIKDLVEIIRAVEKGIGNKREAINKCDEVKRL